VDGQVWDVVGLDTGYFSKCKLWEPIVNYPIIRKDIRDVMVEDLQDFDAVVHLAALSNDPLGNLDHRWTHDINFDGTIHLAQCARAAGIKRFLFFSSCIMYGVSDGGDVNEDSPLNPQTDYARSKVDAENMLRTMADDDFHPTFIRNGTIYGSAAAQRLDTVVNQFVAEAMTHGTVTVLSDGTPWRPIVHVWDVSRTVPVYLQAPIETIHNQAFNNGADWMNMRVREIAEAVVKAIPGAVLKIASESGADQRTYKASFAKFARTFPQFKFDYSLDRGIAELMDMFQRTSIINEDQSKFVRLSQLKHLIADNELDSTLRWTYV